MKLELNKSQKRSDRSEKKLVSNQGPSFVVFPCSFVFVLFFVFFVGLFVFIIFVCFVLFFCSNVHKNKVIPTVLGEEKLFLFVQQ